jgi:hypothetical protein
MSFILFCPKYGSYIASDSGDSVRTLCGDYQTTPSAQYAHRFLSQDVACQFRTHWELEGKPELEVIPLESAPGDMSSGRHSITPATLSKRERDRRNKAAQRARQKAHGSHTLTITLTADEAAAFRALQERQAGPKDDFAKRALITGAKFLYNAGNRRGGKKRVRTIDDARRIQLADCCNSSAGHEDSGPDRQNPAHHENA